MGPRSWHIALLSALVAGFSLSTLGQVSIVQVEVNEMAIAPASLFRCTISNTGPKIDVVLSGTIRSVRGTELLKFVSYPVQLNVGSTSLSGSAIDYSIFMYGSNSEGAMLARDHRLSAGEFQYCIMITQIGGEATTDEYCDLITVEDVLFMDPVYPYDGDTVTELRPALSWTLTSPQVPLGQTARLVLVPNSPGHEAARSLSMETPVYAAQGVRPGPVVHPISAPDLEPGKCYAWQVERLRDGLVVDRTEPWRFCVKKYTPPVVNKYVRLGEIKPSTIYEALDHRIFFRYDEAYAGMVLSCVISDESGHRIPVEASPDGGDRSNAKSIGVNLYEIDLGPLRLDPGYYVLGVSDEKHRHYNLKFHVAP